jgi:hypothetical protein
MRWFKQAAWVLAALLLGSLGSCFAEGGSGDIPPESESEKQFLDRLTMAESSGRLTARNSATSAYGPFQFLAATFLDVVQRNFPQIAVGKPAAEILSLRANPEVSRLAALIYTRENASFLAARGTAVTAANLRLAFFAGPVSAVKVLAAKPEEPVSNILSPAAVEANPFLARMTAGALIEWASREAEGVGTRFGMAAAKGAQAGTRPAIAVRCNLKLASCRKWLALAQKRKGIVTAGLASRPAAP